MINTCTYNNVDGVHSIELNNDIYPLNDFDPTVEQRVERRQKSQQDGLYPVRTQRDGLDLHMEGMILADSSADYFSKRQDHILALFGVPNVTVTDRKTGTLVIGFDGSTEDWSTDVTISLFTCPLKALYPGSSEFAVTFVSWTPWFTGVDSGDLYLLS